MRIWHLVEETNFIDNIKGKGAVPLNQDVSYFGLAVRMKPSKFLELALPLSRADAASAEGLKQHITSGGKIGSPFLDIQIPEDWNDEKYDEPAKVKSHEGRNRMYAIMDLYGDKPVEVHLFFKGGLRARDISETWKKKLAKSLVSEDGHQIVQKVFEL